MDYLESLGAAWSSPTTRFPNRFFNNAIPKSLLQVMTPSHHPQLLTSSLTRGFIYCPNAHARIWLVRITPSDWLTSELWTRTSAQDFPLNLDLVLVLGLCTRTCPNFGHHVSLVDHGGLWTLNSLFSLFLQRPNSGQPLFSICWFHYPRFCPNFVRVQTSDSNLTLFERWPIITVDCARSVSNFDLWLLLIAQELLRVLTTFGQFGYRRWLTSKPEILHFTTIYIL